MEAFRQHNESYKTADQPHDSFHRRYNIPQKFLTINTPVKMKPEPAMSHRTVKRARLMRLLSAYLKRNFTVKPSSDSVTSATSISF